MPDNKKTVLFKDYFAVGKDRREFLIKLSAMAWPVIDNAKYNNFVGYDHVALIMELISGIKCLLIVYQNGHIKASTVPNNCNLKGVFDLMDNEGIKFHGY